MKKAVQWTKWLYRYIVEVMPQVEQRLANWKELAERMPENLLKTQALASIEHKKFHCIGGAVFALYPGARQQEVLDFIVAFQTISDYLDNLCDRAQVIEEQAFRQLHYAMLDAIRPAAASRDYYLNYPVKNDGGYLNQLVTTCQKALKSLGWDEYKAHLAAEWVTLYSELQIYKHLDWSVREKKLETWAREAGKSYWNLYPMEFAAATGSTLGVFALVAGLEPQEASYYFPWITGLHILLDYYIDQEEDKNEGDLNFHFYYATDAEREKRLILFYKNAKDSINKLQYNSFHELVITGLLAMYLSDPKTNVPTLMSGRQLILKESSLEAQILHTLCVFLRKAGKL
ncbi:MULTISPECIES: tetraprenyl-beta-curcumene synthase family protein [unclassified Carboxydocella]|uniref:tetraprenyl-beta-curcumene synthase family protein n=1 Tax=unclassified Carboxydocella TaxID=2685367 RepID=UPI0009AEAE91|nr:MULTISPECIES: tetraprenyl-beta-curcumene synthase family protein [unclassified Carboxydocella]GAW29707.1 hypothetical protein ULO1_22770 [Carboxydocella sp. ULO1]GAW32218.1 hypothetical protein JDF658_19830 [Carboxydocella sp. JDF658]